MLTSPLSGMSVIDHLSHESGRWVSSLWHRDIYIIHVICTTPASCDRVHYNTSYVHSHSSTGLPIFCHSKSELSWQKYAEKGKWNDACLTALFIANTASYVLW